MRVEDHTRQLHSYIDTALNTAERRRHRLVISSLFNLLAALALHLFSPSRAAANIVLATKIADIAVDIAHLVSGINSLFLSVNLVLSTSHAPVHAPVTSSSSVDSPLLSS